MALTFTPESVGGGFTGTDNVQANFQNLATLLQDCLSRSGSAPNTMSSTLDMNSNRIINLPNATGSTEPVTKGQFDAASGSLTPIGFQVEKLTGTVGQTVFNFASINYSVGANTLIVFINGIYQDPSSYTETDSDTVTLSEGVEAGDELSAVVLSLT